MIGGWVEERAGCARFLVVIERGCYNKYTKVSAFEIK
jgi:hypothetical protein